MTLQRTLALIKPDAIRAKQLGAILTFLETADAKDRLTIVNLRMVTMSLPMAGEFYRDHCGKPYFRDLTRFMASGRVAALELEGGDAITKWREGVDKLRFYLHSATRLPWENVVHGSDSPEAAARELGMLFGELSVYTCDSEEWVVARSPEDAAAVYVTYAGAPIDDDGAEWRAEPGNKTLTMRGYHPSGDETKRVEMTCAEWAVKVGRGPLGSGNV